MHHRADTLGYNLGAKSGLAGHPRSTSLWKRCSPVRSRGSSDQTQGQIALSGPGIRWAYNFKNGLQIVPELPSHSALVERR